ncbi:MAG: hypothetical protein IT449_07805 [Phycisphaerales bacterium]|nr:hypothetical protein [Phycisphaerales bacterium]
MVIKRAQCTILMLPAVAFLLPLPALAWAQANGAADAVRVEGSMDSTSQNYTWRVVNPGDATVVRISIPHYHADLFTAPPGWATDCTYLVNVGVPDHPGVCSASAPDAKRGIAPGATGEFSMRIAASGAAPGRGAVEVGFSDGSTATINGVLLPRAPSRGETMLPLASLAVVLVIVLLARALRQRRSALGLTDAPSAASRTGGPER